MKITHLMTLFVFAFLSACSTSPEAQPTNIATATAVPPPTNTMIIESTSPPSQPASSAANADVTFVRVVATGDNRYTFHVTVAHPDTGWEDYADGWDVLLPDGTVVKPSASSPFTRLLVHPHVNEQPFTRSQSGIEISAEITQVTVRAHDLVDGFGGKTVTIDLTNDNGDGYKIER